MTLRFDLAEMISRIDLDPSATRQTAEDWATMKPSAFPQHYSFSAEELDYILNYDIKYRLGADDGEHGLGEWADRLARGLAASGHQVIR